MRDVVSLERNPWDKNSYAILINTENPKIIESFATFVSNHTFEKLTPKSLFFLEIGLDKASFLSFIPGGDTYGDSADAVNDCFVKKEIGYCAASGVFLLIPFVPGKPIKDYAVKFVKGVGETRGYRLIVKYANEIFQFFHRRILTLQFDTFAEAFKKAGEYGEDIYRFFAINAMRFDDLISGGTKSINDIPLSDGGRSIREASSSGSDLNSIIVSYENTHRRGASLLKPGEEIQWKNIPNMPKPIDHLSKIGNDKVGFSVARAYTYPPNVFDEDAAQKLVFDKFDDLARGVDNLNNPADDLWDVGVVHILSPNEASAKLVEESFKRLPKSVVGNNKLILTVTDNLDYIYRGK